MPFVQRQIEPKYIARRSAASKKASSSGSSPLRDNEFEAITNLTLSNAMRQLASLLALSKEIFTELNKELEVVSERSTRIKSKLTSLQNKVDDPSYDAKLVVVPECDLITFIQIKNHYKTEYGIHTNLFTLQTRTDTLRQMYENAAKTPVRAIAEMDEILGDCDRRSSDAFICTPILGQIRRRMKNSIDIEIETRMPAAVEELRKWTSNEAIGDVTVAPDCLARVSHNTSVADQTIISMRPSTSYDTTDDITIVNGHHNISRRSENSDKDVPLDHRLPSPEEQCLILASKYPAQIVKVDTSGKRFDRQSAARKSLLHVQSGLHAIEDANDSSNTDSVKRRSRSRKPRGNRRNTIAGTDQKEIEGITENGLADDGDEVTADGENEITIVPRSKSSDVLKKDLLTNEVKRSSSHFNSLKQWGKSRLRMINRLSGTSDDTTRSSFRYKPNSDDIDDFNVLDAINKRQKKINEKDRRLSHERKPSYSSSERSLTVSSGFSSVTITQPNTNNQPVPQHPVKMRDPTALRRHHRTGLTNKDEPHSSSGNWSASSESGRTSIGSEITTTTTHPKSSASSTSLNHNTHPSSSGPPSSIISRRRFLNTSASSSITSEGTATPELQMFDGLHDEGETSSVYSCDTEGYYTSFHVDSGLKTLKEEEPITPMHSLMALSSSNSFESSGNQTVISPENEYELFGKGSTTTSSSAGTVCTAVLSHYDNERPSVPERKSSLGMLNRSGSLTSSGTLVRSCSTSTVGSTLEKGATIKRNGVLLQKEVSALVHQHKLDTVISRIDSPDSGNNTSSSPVDSNSSPTNQNMRVYSEFECSESSDLECVERTERIRVKTTINTSRIPSMCVITPSPSDDESKLTKNEEKIKIKDNVLNLNKDTGYATVMSKPPEIKITRKTSPLLPLNQMLGKLRGVLHPLKKSPNKENNSPKYDSPGDYVTIADIQTPKKSSTTSNGVYYSTDVLKRNLATVLSGNLNEETEYVSLNELPCNMRSESNLLAISENSPNEKIDKSGRDKNKGAVVKLDAHGKAIFDSNSLKRKKGAITTFSPGPCVKESTESIATTTIIASSSSSSSSKNICESQEKIAPESAKPSASIYRRTVNSIRPVVSQRGLKNKIEHCEVVSEENNNIVTKSSSSSSLPPVEITKTEPVSMSTANGTTRPNGSMSLNLNSVSSKVLASGSIRGAYVNIQDAAPLRNGPPVYSPPSPSRAATLFHQQPQQQHQHEDYQRLYRDNEMMSSSFNSGYQWSSNDNDYDSAPQFQRSNNIYWTLQTRSKGGQQHHQADNAYQTRDDSVQSRPTIGHSQDIESLYSTPNKNQRNQLKTTPMGFEFFSPVAPSRLNERIEEEDETDTLEIMSPIDPRNVGVFSASTPQKNPNFSTMSPAKTSLTEDLRSRLRLQNPGIRSMGNSPISSGRSTPKCIFEPQHQQQQQQQQQQSRSRHSWSSNNVEIPSTSTCSDRLGTPKTTLMDFKKLLLNKNPSARSGKLSAVELLKQSKTNVQKSPSPTPGSLNSSMHILDMSGSPKTFATRRMIRQGQFGPNLSNSPSKTSNKQKNAWRLQNMRTDVISTAIPEAVNDEEQETTASNIYVQRQPIEIKKSPDIVIKDVTEVEAEVEHEKAMESLSVNLKENLFIKQQENNFTENEIREHKKSATLSLQQQRAQFFLGVNNTATSNPTTINNNKTAVFKSGGHYTGIVTTAMPPTNKETTPLKPNNLTASLETAL